ncbi:MAG TPA: hypothetical protein VNO75_04590 [Gemmatimonadaceae bacterium]|nr:hypothetical protein [Gemmatimonadaceae bacterium]
MYTQQADPAPTPPRPVITTQTGTNAFTIEAPVTARELAALKARRSELSSQLISANERRTRLVTQLNNSDNATVRAGLEERIGILDKRMVQLESDIASTGQVLTSASGGLAAATASADSFIPGLASGQVTALSIVFTVVFLGPLAIGAARMMWKRSSRPLLPPAFNETARRVERLEQSVDAIAIEIERVSEGQRFVTKLLSESQHLPALSAAARSEPISAGNQ